MSHQLLRWEVAMSPIIQNGFFENIKASSCTKTTNLNTIENSIMKTVIYMQIIYILKLL